MGALHLVVEEAMGEEFLLDKEVDTGALHQHVVEEVEMGTPDQHTVKEAMDEEFPEKRLGETIQ